MVKLSYLWNVSMEEREKKTTSKHALPSHNGGRKLQLACTIIADLLLAFRISRLLQGDPALTDCVWTHL